MNRASAVTVAVAMGLTLLAGAPSNATSSASAPSITPQSVATKKKPEQKSKKKAKKKKAKKRGTLRVVAQGIPQGGSAKITVAGKRYRKKLPAAGKLRNLKPGKYRVWAAPIVVDGGTSSVSDLPVRVKVRKSKLTVRLQYTWNPRTDSYPPGPADELKVSGRTTSSIDLSWVNGSAPDLQAVAVRRKAGSVAPASLDEGRALSLAGFATSITDTGLRPHTTYSYSVFMVDFSGNASRPVSVVARTTAEAVAVTAGLAHTCALVKGDTVSPDLAAADQGQAVECWGDNTHGQLGNGTTTDAEAPSGVDLTGAVQVVAGGEHTCVRQRTAGVVCWGRNDEGQAGQPGAKDVPAPATVELPAAVDLAAGGGHTCAVLSNGSVRCWGANDRGQLGVAAPTRSDVPIVVPGISNAVSVTAGYAHTCAVLNNGSVRCWGANDHGQLGNNSTDDASVPVRPQVADVASLTAGVFHTCALLDDNSVQCWGGNEHGQLGDGGSSDALMPTEVSMPAASMVSAGAYHTCAVTGSNVRCWGRNQGGRLGDGTQIDRGTPTRI
ncbi:MAG TPA: hypothetical protein PLQ14_12195, partial [Actinomycetota bacterium]|nr:hypothetical protein [Actinomycetota bacterium]